MKWTIETLKEHFEQRFADNDKALTTALQAAREEARKLASELKQYKAEANEWRGAMKDKDTTYARTTEMERIETDVKKLQLWEAKLSGMATQQDVNVARKESNNAKWFGIISAGLGIVAIIISLFK